MNPPRNQDIKRKTFPVINEYFAWLNCAMYHLLCIIYLRGRERDSEFSPTGFVVYFPNCHQS